MEGKNIEDLFKSPPELNVSQEEIRKLYIKYTKMLMDTFSDDERHEIMLNYCHACGSKNPRCQCWNDD